MKGVAAITSSEVARFAQTNSGIRQKVIPGARMVTIVTRKLSAARIEEKPANWTPMLKKRLPERRAGGERRVAGPAGVEGAARDQEARHEDDSRQDQQPEAERVQPRESHIRGADHQRQDVVGDPGEDRDHEEEDHDRRVRGEDRVVARGVDDLRPRLGELSADQHRQQATDEKEEEGGDDVLDPDHLVIGVEGEVVAPGGGAMARMVLGAGRLSQCPANPVGERAEADQEAKCSGDHRDDYMWVAGLFGLEDRQTRYRSQPDDQGKADSAADKRSADATRPLAEKLVSGNTEIGGLGIGCGAACRPCRSLERGVCHQTSSRITFFL